VKGKKTEGHPYIPNSVKSVQTAMMADIGIRNIEELYQAIPLSLRLNRLLELPKPLPSELELKRHVMNILSRNQTCEQYTSFLGGGCYRHYVPAICDEINQRSEFLTAYAGEPYEDHGRFQSLFEFQSLMAELLDLEVVNVPTYDWSQAASTVVRMAGRITGRDEILIADTISPGRRAVIQNYCHPVMKVDFCRHDPATGMLDLNDLESKFTPRTAGIYFENPSYLGFIETQGKSAARIAHSQGGLSLVGVDPISLGILEPPGGYGADIVCGDIQSLGMHMHFGGGLAGFIATRDKKDFVMEYPSRLFGIARTSVEGEYGFGDVAYDRTSFGMREAGKEFVGTHSALWGITAAVYLSLVGPVGMEKLARTILERSLYAQSRINEITCLRSPLFSSPHFKEFVVDFNGTGLSVAEVNHRLYKRGIFGGKDLSREFEDLSGCSLYCVTEMHSQTDINRLADALKDICSQGGSDEESR